MSSLRQNKVSRLIQKELADIFQKEMRNAFGPGLISVTHVFVSPDIGFSKTYLSLFGAPDAQKMLESIRKEAKEIRRCLGTRIGRQLRVVPEVAFFLDDSAEYAEKMEKVFSAINTPPPAEEPKPKRKTRKKSS